MPQFDWTDQDPMDGLDTELSAEEQAFIEPPKPQPASPSEIQRRAAAVVAQVNAPVQPIPTAASAPSFEGEPELSEVEIRLAKAQCYSVILGSQLLQGDDPVSLEVEAELQEWAHQRLEELMGVRRAAPSNNANEIAELVRANTPPAVFTEDEVTALKAIASRVLTPKPATPSTPPSVKPVQTQPEAPRAPQAVAPAPTPKPAAQPSIKPAVAVQPVKRGRGRPRKNPCPKCGQMVCVCKYANNNLPSSAPAPARTNEQIEMLPDGTKIKTVGNKRYKVVQKEVIDRRTGGTTVIEVDMDITPTPKLPTAAPYPNEMQVAALAAVEAQNNLSTASNNKSLAKAIGASLKTGE